MSSESSSSLSIQSCIYQSSDQSGPWRTIAIFLSLQQNFGYGKPTPASSKMNRRPLVTIIKSFNICLVL